MKEAIQLVQAFAISRITYGTVHHCLTRPELEKLNVVIKKAVKSALSVPERTATDRLMEVGVHNTLEELRGAQIAAQLKRLDGTAKGRWLLGKLNLEAEVSRASHPGTFLRKSEPRSRSSEYRRTCIRRETQTGENQDPRPWGARGIAGAALCTVTRPGDRTGSPRWPWCHPTARRST